MSNEQKIIDKIMAEAQAERDKIIAEAQKQVDAVIQKAEDLAEKELLSATVESRQEAEKTASKEISGAQREAKNRILKVKQECLGKAMELALQKLTSLAEEEYKDVILSMLEKAEKGDEIIFSPQDKQRLESTVREKGLQVCSQTRDILGGFIVKKGEIEYNYSFEAIMAVEKEELEQIAAKILFA